MKSSEADVQAVIEVTEGVLTSVTPSPEFCDLLLWALKRQPIHHFWVTLPLQCCVATGGPRTAGLLLSAVILLATSAASILDDIQDEDTNDALWRHVGPAQAMNIGVALAFGAPALINRLQHADIPLPVIIRLHEECTGTVFTMCGGQHADLSSMRSRNAPTLDQYWTMTAAKTASLFAWGCRAGASLGSSQDPLDTYELYGHHLGLLHQCLNDLGALYGLRGKVDFGVRQWNLPYLYALTVAPSNIKGRIATIWEAADRNTEKRGEARELLFQTGAPQYLRIVIEEHYQKAQQALDSMQGDSEALTRLEEGLLQVAYLIERLDRQGAEHGLDP